MIFLLISIASYTNRWLLRCSRILFGFVAPVSSDLGRIMPKRNQTRNGQIEYTEDVPSWKQRWQNALQDVLPLWLSDISLNEIGNCLHRHREAE